MRIWRAEEIKGLRLRLGWSAANFARHLNYSIDIILAWERGEKNPSPTEGLQLERLEFNLDEYCDQLHVCPIAEIELNKMGLSQICLTDIISQDKNT